jgi:hypothetical protein
MKVYSEDTKHTPGPWRIGDAGMTVFGPKVEGKLADIVAQLFRPKTTAESQIRKANARLIAAAPDLLEACRAGLSVCEAESANWQAEIIRAAIAKATGEE